ncbi:MAG: hypothetical protein HYZ79_08370 [Candidatus Melainabacteria bacterium]|nr:hypothetical protein [Candidatus Melainabacteria bacterium]
MINTSNKSEFGFKEDHNFVIKDNVLTLKLYDPPSYSFKEVDAELNPHTPLGHELSHMLAGGFYFNEFDPSGAYLWGQKIDDSLDPGRALFFECWVIHGQVISDPNVDLEYKHEHFKKGRQFLEETFPILYQKPIPSKWLERWDKLKEQIKELTDFRASLPIDPWFPSNFKKVKLSLY